MRRIMDRSPFHPCSILPPSAACAHCAHWTFSGCYHSVLRYHNIFRIHFVTRTHQSFPFLRYMSCTFIYCVFIYYIICFGIRVFFEVAKSMNENGIKNHQAPNTKITQGDVKLEEVINARREEEKCVRREKFLFLPRMEERTRAIAIWLCYHHIHTRIRHLRSHLQNPHILL